MKFLKNNWAALVIIILLLANELLHLMFKDIPFNDKVNMNAPIYYFTLAFRNVATSMILLYFVLKSNMKTDAKRASKSLIVGAIGWNLIELYQEFCYLAKIDEKVLFFNDGLWGQLTFIYLLIFLTYFGSSKLKY